MESFTDLIEPPPPTGNFLGIASGVVSPVSRGSVTLNSSDPLSDPLIDLNFFDSEVDFFILREGIRSLLRFASQPQWADYVISPITVHSTSTDAELDNYVRANASAFYHAAGTASMSPKGANWGVVDPDLVLICV
ncbi:hypothetical protein B0H11DRAFT_1724260 [Mycena galericulata]|nr:hypothetical protein B0H11DRAFT_1724260 [Mycena galericulata]